MNSSYRFDHRHIFRTTYFSPDELKATTQEDEIEMFFSERMFSVFALATPEVAGQLQADWKNGKLGPKHLRTIRRYLKRLAFRATPFGHIAGVGVLDVTQPAEPLKPERLMLKLHPRVKNLPHVKDLWGLNPRAYWDGSRLILRTEKSIRKDEFKPDASTKKFLKSLQLPQTRAQAVKALARAHGSTTKEVMPLWDELCSAQLLVSLDDAVFFQSKSDEMHPWAIDSSPNVENGTAALRFSGQPERLITAGLSSATSIALKVHQAVNPDDQLSQVRPMVAALTQHLRLAHDHGPLPLLKITEGALPLMPAVPPRLTTSEKLIQQLVAPVLLRGERVWRLDDELLDKFRSSQKRVTQPPAVLGFHGLSGATGQSWQFSHVFVRSAVQMVGRFAPMLPAATNLLQDIQSAEQSHTSAKVVDLEYRPTDSIMRFVSVRQSYATAYIDCTGAVAQDSERIPLSDVGVWLRGENLELIQLSTSIPLELHKTHMTNAFPREDFHFRLLNEISAQRPCIFPLWPWGPVLSSAAFLPRVEYKGVILFRARWNLDAKSFPQPLTAAVIQDLLHKLTPTLPARVLLTVNDRSLPFESNAPNLATEVKQELLKFGRCSLEEDLLQPDERRFEFNSFAFTQSKPAHTSLPQLRKPRRHVSWRIYLNPEENGELMRKLAKLCAGLGHPEFWFICYARPDFHLRWRFFPRTTAEENKICQAIEKFLQAEWQLARVRLYHRARYEPELRRWGGAEGLRLMEKMSAEDTLMLLESFGPRPWDESKEIFQAFNRTVDGLFPSLDEQNSFLRWTLANVSSANQEENALPTNFDPGFKPYRSSPPKEWSKLCQTWESQECYEWAASMIHMNVNRRKLSGCPFNERHLYKLKLHYNHARGMRHE